VNGNEPVTPTVLGEGGRSWRPTAVGLTHILVLPQGFTLAIAGSLAICLGRHGYPGPLGVWLFVAGASAGYCLLILAFGALRPTVSQPVASSALACSTSPPWWLSRSSPWAAGGSPTPTSRTSPPVSPSTSPTFPSWPEPLSCSHPGHSATSR